MKSWHRDPDSHIGIVPVLLELSDLPASERETLRRELERYMRVRINRRLWLQPSITAFHTEWYRELYRVIGVRDPYKGLKRRSVTIARQLLHAVRPVGLRCTVLASIVANRLDFGVLGDLNPKTRLDSQDFVNLEELALFIDDFHRLSSRLTHARRLLYLLDNQGEVLFDLAVINEIRKMNSHIIIHIAAKSAPMLNDVTYEELTTLKLPHNCSAVSTGSNCFGVPEDEVSSEFKEILASADVVIAKGHSYLEFWTEYAIENVFHLATTKFEIHDRWLGEIPARANVILSSRRYSQGKVSYGLRSHIIDR